uniref:Serpentine receptor class gamma n=1 Tax=Caenorhabditis japonica TaxID=281687 RepID=A0A8R1DXU4_CAEJA
MFQVADENENPDKDRSDAGSEFSIEIEKEVKGKKQYFTGGMSNTSYPLNGSVHGLKAYADYVVVINYTTMQAFVPFLYILPTICVMLRILFIYHKTKKSRNAAVMDHNIFALIMFYFMFNSLFYFGDYIHLNLPSSGLMTTWCASIQPSRYFAILIIYAYAANYGVIICPFLVCLIRLIIILSPRHNERYCRLAINYFATPFLFITPILLTIVNYQITGYCKQMGEPFSFGSLIIYEGESFAELNIYIHILFSIVIFSSTMSMNCVMYYKLRKVVFETTSDRTKSLTRRAERSLHLTMISCVIPFITNSICSLTFIFNRSYYYHVLFLRPIGNDYETVMMPWVLYLTHPMFRQQKSKQSTASASHIFVTSNTLSRMSVQT